jgi:predicted small lipoprotein YifL
MRKTMMAMGVAALALALTACGKSGPPPKRQPGSWSQTTEIKRVEGGNAEQNRAALTQLFKKMDAVTICVTPEWAEKEDPAANVERLGSGGATCTFDKKSVAGGNLDVAGTCKDATGKGAKIAATGTLTATDQDMNMTVEAFDPYGATQGLMELRIHSVRRGECTATDKVPSDPGK